MPERKRRRPDGRQKTRSLDEMLAEAVAADGDRELPDKGKPLDLGRYFADDPEQRAANKILKDNDVIPPALQFRTDAERLRAAADEAIAGAAERLAKQLEEVRRRGAELAALLPADASIRITLGLDTLPDYVPEAAGPKVLYAGKALDVAEALSELVDAFNSERKRSIDSSRDRLRETATAVSKANERLSTPGVPALPRLPAIDIDECIADFESTFPRLPIVAPELIEALRRGRRSALQRILDFLLPS